MKLRTLLLLILSLTLLSFSCSNDENDEPSPPKTVNQTYPDDTIDINNDGLNDFVIYSQTLATTDEPSSYQSNMREIVPLIGNGNKNLYKSGGGGLFLNEGDTIKATVSIPLNWSEYPSTLISISTRIGVLDEYWRISSNKTNDYFYAFQLNNVTPSQIGWMLFEFNIYTGAYTIVDKEWTANSTLVIQK